MTASLDLRLARLRWLRYCCLFCVAQIGCSTQHPFNQQRPTSRAATASVTTQLNTEQLAVNSVIRQVSGSGGDNSGGLSAPAVYETAQLSDSLNELEHQSQRNPTLTRLSHEYQAARAKVRYIDELPDPTIAANVFGHPIETAAGSQRANLTLSQMLPWLPRLDAQAQQACFEAAALWQVYSAEQLRIIADVRSLWNRLYVLQKQIDINTANQQLLESLIEVANSRVSTGKASQGDVLAGTLEYSKLEEQLVTLRQQLATAKANINRQVGRDASTPILGPTKIDGTLPAWETAVLRELAWANQPDIEAARIRSHASRWGVEVARLKRRPDFTVNASWFAIDDNRPTPNIVDVGKDAWALGAMMTLPIRNEKYDAIEQEALWRHAAANASIEEVRQRYDALLVDLWEQARAADETARLYMDTIIPEAKRTLDADQQAYMNGDVEFDRVVRDFRNLLTLELGYHRSLGQLATAIARIQQATGTELSHHSGSERDNVVSTEESVYTSERFPTAGYEPPMPTLDSRF